MSPAPVVGLDDLPLGEHRATCPECGRGPRDRTLGISVHPDRTVAHCFRCGAATAWRKNGSGTAVSGPVARPAAKPSPDTHLSLASHWRRVWDYSGPIRGSIGAEYLEARGCA